MLVTMGSNIHLVGFRPMDSGRSVWVDEPLAPNMPDMRDQRPKSDPDIVLLCTWANGGHKSIYKYARHYREAYPGATVLLLESSFWSVAVHTEHSQDDALRWAVDLIKDQDHPHVLAHVFSSGGVYQFTELAKRYKKATQALLPLDALVIDSAPGDWRAARLARAMAVALPRQWFLYYTGVGLIWLYVCLLVLYLKATRGTVILVRVANDLNDPGLVSTAARRLYIFSRSDEMVHPDGVLAHCAQAQKRSYAVQLEEFSGTKHVAHMVKDPSRYWGVVSEHWSSSKVQ